MKVIVTGANGQLGKDMVEALNRQAYEVFGYSKEELDISNGDAVMQCFQEINPDVIIHCAAYTKVDQAQTNPELAYQINACGTKNVALAAESVGAKMCYVSTDYVFDGLSERPYCEEDQPNPLSIYGKSKLEGERGVREISSRWFIVRTSWVYGRHGSNFVKTMLRLAGEREVLGVVNDQTGSPTYTVDLANFIVELIQTEAYGIYHASNIGSCTWYEFAKAIFEEAGISIVVHPLTTDQYPTPAPRPPYSVLDHGALHNIGFQELRHWREALREYLKNFVL